MRYLPGSPFLSLALSLSRVRIRAVLLLRLLSQLFGRIFVRYFPPAPFSRSRFLSLPRAYPGRASFEAVALALSWRWRAPPLSFTSIRAVLVLRLLRSPVVKQEQLPREWKKCCVYAVQAVLERHNDEGHEHNIHLDAALGSASSLLCALLAPLSLSRAFGQCFCWCCCAGLVLTLGRAFVRF